MNLTGVIGQLLGNLLPLVFRISFNGPPKADNKAFVTSLRPPFPLLEIKGHRSVLKGTKCSLGILFWYLKN